MLKKIIVIGCPGAGKSTFSRKLKEIIHLPLYHLDMIWHNSNKTNISNEEFDKALNNILITKRWIIDGNYQRTLDARLKSCDTIFLLDYPLDICLSGAESRIGKKRFDFPWIEMQFDNEFKQWIIDFPNKELPLIYNMLDNYSDKNIVIFKTRNQADDYLKELKININSFEKILKT